MEDETENKDTEINAETASADNQPQTTKAQAGEGPSKHQLKELRRKERESQRENLEQARVNEQRRKSLIQYGIIGAVLLGLVGLGYGFVQLLPEGSGTYTQAPIHWHASLEIVTCGQTRELPMPLPGQHLGTGILHTHEDQLIHIEGVIPNEEAIMLKRYMDNIGLHFKNNEILDYQNGELCNGKPGSVKLLVNGEENNLLTEYVIKDGDKLRIEFN